MAYRNYGNNVGFIVDPNGLGDFTTIGAAITAAVSGDSIFVRPGTYTENLTLKTGVTLTSNLSNGWGGVTVIVGKCSYTGGGTTTISNIKLQTNSDYCLAFTGSSSGSMVILDCFIDCTNHTGIQFSNSNSGSAMTLDGIDGDIGTTGIAFLAHSAAGYLFFYNSEIGNSGSSATASTGSGTGQLIIEEVQFNNALTISSTCTLQMAASIINTAPVVATGLTFNSTTSNACVLNACRFDVGSNAAVSVGSSATLYLAQCIVNSSATDTITGSGTVNLGIITFVGSSTGINTTTVNKLTTYGGTIV